MFVVDMVGWIAAASSASLAVPQGARIAMTRSVAGISTVTWQTMLIAGLAWTAHGLLTGTAQVIWPNALLGITSAWVLWQLTTARALPIARTWSVPMVVAALAFGADLAFGPLAFAAIIFVPGAVGQSAQLRAIVRVANPSGVSMVALLANLLNQVLWFSYALPTGELAILSVSIPMAFLMAASVLALWLRRRQLASGRTARLYGELPETLALATVIPAPVDSDGARPADADAAVVPLAVVGEAFAPVTAQRLQR